VALHSAGRKARLDPDVFRLPVDRIREGYYTDAYFNFTKELLEATDRHPHVVMQVFQKRRSVLGGIDEALAILKLCAGRDQPGGEWRAGWPTRASCSPRGSTSRSPCRLR
jgi:nicotinate phosphoribosyltransferase